MAVYLLCFSEAISHSKHYLGFAVDNDVSARIAKHRSGQGLRICRAAAKRGIEIRLAVVIPDADRNFERKLKNQKMANRWCPLCAVDAKRRRKVPIFTPLSLDKVA